MVIRPLKRDELVQCAELGKSFYEEAGLPGRFVIAQFVSFWEPVLTGGIGTIVGAFRDDKLVGVIGGLRAPDPNDGEMVASEMFWFVLPKERGVGLRLLEFFEAWAVVMGCKRIMMVHLSNETSGPLGRLYERRGYRPVEVHYVREV